MVGLIFARKPSSTLGDSQASDSVPMCRSFLQQPCAHSGHAQLLSFFNRNAVRRTNAVSAGTPFFVFLQERQDMRCRNAKICAAQMRWAGTVCLSFYDVHFFAKLAELHIRVAFVRLADNDNLSPPSPDVCHGKRPSATSAAAISMPVWDLYWFQPSKLIFVEAQLTAQLILRLGRNFPPWRCCFCASECCRSPFQCILKVMTCRLDVTAGLYF